MALISKEVHGGDRLFEISIYVFKYVINYFKYRKLLGSYKGGTGNITIRYPFFKFGKFVIDGVEPKGERWRGEYKIDKSGFFFEGVYRWNIGRNIAVADIGKHQLYISEDRKHIYVNWEDLTGSGRKGKATWQKES